MSKVIVYGYEVDRELRYVPRKTRGTLANATIKAFSQIMGIGKFTKNQMDILVNEIVRGRLSLEHKDNVLSLANILMKIYRNGFSFKDIAILRSLCFEFEEIYEMSKSDKKLENIINDLGVENPDIETIYGLTSKDLAKRFVSYEVAKGV